MKRFIIVIICLSNILFAQAKWYWKNPQPTGNNLYSIKFVDENNGWIVGATGTVMRTINGGIIWEMQPSITENNLSSVFFINQNIGWAAGENGTIIKTTNGGLNWISQNSGTAYKISSIFFVDKNNGWAVGGNVLYNPADSPYYVGVILNTTDGGSNWITNDNPDYFASFNAVYFKDINNGYVITSPAGDVLETSDGGKNWSSYLQKQNESGIFLAFSSIYFLDDNTGWVVGQRKAIIKTEDGGKSWQVKMSSNSSDVNLNSVFFINKNIGWAAANNATIIYTTDGGTSWQDQESGLEKNSDININSIYFKNENLGWAVSNNGVILITTNGGINWLNNKNATNQVNGKIKFIGDTGFAFGKDGVVFKTEDNGSTWKIFVHDPLWMFGDDYFIDDLNGWFTNVGNYAKEKGGTYKTTDGGITWRCQTDVETYYATGIYFIDKNIGNLIGLENRIFHTTDGGVTWIRIPINDIPQVNFRSISFFDKSNGIVVGQANFVQSYADAIGITTDGGESWNFTYEKGDGLRSIFMVDSTSAWVTGEDIRKTTDKGRTWISKYKGDYINSVSFADNNNGYAIGNSGLMLYTSDGGNNWTKLNQMTSNDLNYITFSKTGIGWISASNTVLTTEANNINSDTLLTNYPAKDSIIVDSSITTNYYLYQCYPNPFNSFTTIKYSLQKEEQVIIKVYDLLGREVVTLVNGYKKAGKYSKIFDASKLSSGLYFYRMIAGNFSETKKMILLK